MDLTQDVGEDLKSINRPSINQSTPQHACSEAEANPKVT